MTNLSERSLVLGGAVLLIVGSFMTWISVDVGFAQFSATGTENIEGKLTAGSGIVLILVALTLVGHGRLRAISGYLGIAAAIFGAGVLLLEYLEVQQRIAETDPARATATVGLGVWVTALGAVAALAAAIWAVRSQRRASAA